MNVQQRVMALKGLSAFIHDYLSNSVNPLASKFQKLDDIIHQAFLYNNWFSPENTKKSLKGITHLLSNENLNELQKIIKEPSAPKTIAIIMAGNIPAVGFHDLASVLLCGHKVLIKLSSDDKIIIPFLVEVLIEIEPAFKNFIQYGESKLSNFDAVIATGSNNTANYFEYYFGKYPHIIRKNRNSVAILKGDETPEELKDFGNDVFDYFGLGCRNVSKVYVPKEYNFNTLFENLISYADVLNNNKYVNNYEYNRTIYLMSQDKFLDNNFLIIKNSTTSIASPIGVLFYEEYDNELHLNKLLLAHKDAIQCVVSKKKIKDFSHISFGCSQCPGFFDYADGVDVVAFLNKL